MKGCGPGRVELEDVMVVPILPAFMHRALIKHLWASNVSVS
jgi:hypothetical protein